MRRKWEGLVIESKMPKNKGGASGGGGGGKGKAKGAKASGQEDT